MFLSVESKLAIRELQKKDDLQKNAQKGHTEGVGMRPFCAGAKYGY
jgi:hypothetical protein